MTPSKLDRILSDRAEESCPVLSSEFSTAVLGQARQVRQALIRHRKLLAISSLVAIALAVLVSIQVGKGTEEVPPPMDSFLAPTFGTVNPLP